MQCIVVYDIIAQRAIATTTNVDPAVLSAGDLVAQKLKGCIRGDAHVRLRVCYQEKRKMSGHRVFVRTVNSVSFNSRERKVVHIHAHRQAVIDVVVDHQRVRTC